MLVLLTMLFSAHSSAAIWCSGKLVGVYITSTGDVIINGSWRNEWTRICNLNEGATTTVVCSMWASYAASARQNDLNVTLMYDTGPASCNEIPSYQGAPTPIYFMILGQ